MSAKRVAGDAEVVNVSSLALIVSLRRKMLSLLCSSMRRLPTACHALPALPALSTRGGVGAWAVRDAEAPRTMIPPGMARRNTDQGKGLTNRAPQMKARCAEP